MGCPVTGTQVWVGGQGARQADREPEAQWAELGTGSRHSCGEQTLKELHT